uniref:NADH dehydrogenase subunit 6 n=1 Tax=Parascaris univalens TaxID=6257 RepID=A0A915AAD9_PARUN
MNKVILFIVTFNAVIVGLIFIFTSIFHFIIFIHLLLFFALYRI